jgi:Gpi18-like mannosyltransferase
MEHTRFFALNGLMATRKRFVLPLIATTAVRVLLGILLYLSLQTGGSFSVPFMSNWKLSFDWLYLFSAWDSGSYRLIALGWYPPKLAPQWAFFPLYPATVRLLSLVGLDVGLGAFIVPMVCGCASIMVFQKIAERYMGKMQGAIAASMYFLFPPIFVFSAASYPESMFLLFSLLSWHFHQEKSDLKASMAAGLCSLCRPEGFLLVIPLLYDYVRKRQFRKAEYLLIPLSATGVWELYGLFMTGVWLPTRAAGAFWNTPKAKAVKLAIQQLAQGNLSSVGILLPYSWLILTIITIIVIVLFLAWRVWKIDKALSVYLLAATLIISLPLSLAFRSFPRILSFFFPVGLPLHTRNLKLLVFLALLFLVLDYVAWLAFLTDGFY